MAAEFDFKVETPEGSFQFQGKKYCRGYYLRGDYSIVFTKGYLSDDDLFSVLDDPQRFYLPIAGKTVKFGDWFFLTEEDAKAKALERVKADVNRLESRCNELELDMGVEGLMAIGPDFSPVTIIGIKPNGLIRVWHQPKDKPAQRRSYELFSLYVSSDANLKLVEEIEHKELQASISTEEAGYLRDELNKGGHLTLAHFDEYRKSNKASEELRK